MQALQAEGAKALRANRYNFTRGGAALNNNPNISDAMRAKANNQINEDVALAIPGVLGNTEANSSNLIQNAYGNQASGYSDAAKTSLEAYKTTYKPSIFSTVLGAAAPFLSFVPGVGPLLSMGASALSSATGGTTGSTGSAAGLAGWQYQQQRAQNNSINQIANLPSGITMPSTAHTAQTSTGTGTTGTIADNMYDDTNSILKGTNSNNGNPQNLNPFQKFNSSILNNSNNEFNPFTAGGGYV